MFPAHLRSAAAVLAAAVSLHAADARAAILGIDGYTQAGGTLDVSASLTITEDDLAGGRISYLTFTVDAWNETSGQGGETTTAEEELERLRREREAAAAELARAYLRQDEVEHERQRIREDEELSESEKAAALAAADAEAAAAREAARQAEEAYDEASGALIDAEAQAEEDRIQIQQITPDELVPRAPFVRVSRLSPRQVRVELETPLAEAVADLPLSVILSGAPETPVTWLVMQVGLQLEETGPAVALGGDVVATPLPGAAPLLLAGLGGLAALRRRRGAAPAAVRRRV